MHADLSNVLSFLQRLGLPPRGSIGDDQPLLARFVAGDEAAFTALVGKYATLVWGVCRRQLGTTPDAEDAFQATFFILARQARRLADGPPLGPWLHTVARRTAIKALLRRVRQQDRERAAACKVAYHDPTPTADLGPILDEELARLPEHYRQPMVLCYLEGLTNEEAARRLACPPGTVLSRLARARERLRQRLTRRGLSPALAASPAVVASPAPASLIALAAQAGPAFLAGRLVGLSSSALSLAQGVLMNLLLRKLLVATLVLGVLSLAAVGTGWRSRPPLAPSAQAAPRADVPAPQVVERLPPGDPAVQAPKKAPPVDAEGKIQQALTGIVVDQLELEAGNPLEDILDMLSKNYEVAFEINYRAFKGDGLVEPGKMPLEQPLRLSKVPLSEVLDRLLTRVPAPSGATYLVRNHFIEITTHQAVGRELGLAIATKGSGNPKAPILQHRTVRLVNHSLHKVTLGQALEELAQATNFNIIVDVRVNEKVALPVSARLNNVPIDTAVRLLADMAELAVVRMDNVFYVTSPENARKLTAEEKNRPAGEERHLSSPLPLPEGGM
ncbi:MAG: sigma-70 family RNA polymerase sigma factor [Gemmataceae bacterium]